MLGPHRVCHLQNSFIYIISFSLHNESTGSWSKYYFLSPFSGTPLQYSCLENPMGGGAWWATVHGVAKSRTRLRDFTFTFHFPALEKKMATHSSVLAWRIPGTGEPGGLASVGSHRVRHDWSDLGAAAASIFQTQIRIKFSGNPEIKTHHFCIDVHSLVGGKSKKRASEY